ncbi:MAG: PIN domain-containing protein [Clostridia bacterium]|nr:PIN domain-containing protein [Clostridia bacterium]
MKVLIDTNVILDVLCSREPFLEASSLVWKHCETNRIEGYISAVSVPNIVYILRKELSPERTEQIIEQLFLIFKVADLRADDLKKAAAMKALDFEDSIQIVCASRIKADFIVTRNIRDFAQSKITAVKPTELLERI